MLKTSCFHENSVSKMFEDGENVEVLFEKEKFKATIVSTKDSGVQVRFCCDNTLVTIPHSRVLSIHRLKTNRINSNRHFEKENLSKNERNNRNNLSHAPIQNSQNLKSKTKSKAGHLINRGKIVQVLFYNRWYRAIIRENVPEGIRVRFCCDNTSYIVPSQYIYSQIRCYANENKSMNEINLNDQEKIYQKKTNMTNTTTTGTTTTPRHNHHQILNRSQNPENDKQHDTSPENNNIIEQRKDIIEIGSSDEEDDNEDNENGDNEVENAQDDDDDDDNIESRMPMKKRNEIIDMCTTDEENEDESGDDDNDNGADDDGEEDDKEDMRNVQREETDQVTNRNHSDQEVGKEEEEEEANDIYEGYDVEDIETALALSLSAIEPTQTEEEVEEGGEEDDKDEEEEDDKDEEEEGEDDSHFEKEEEEEFLQKEEQQELQAEEEEEENENETAGLDIDPEESDEELRAVLALSIATAKTEAIQRDTIKERNNDVDNDDDEDIDVEDDDFEDEEGDKYITVEEQDGKENSKNKMSFEVDNLDIDQHGEEYQDDDEDGDGEEEDVDEDDDDDGVEDGVEVEEDSEDVIVEGPRIEFDTNFKENEKLEIYFNGDWYDALFQKHVSTIGIQISFCIDHSTIMIPNSVIPSTVRRKSLIEPQTQNNTLHMDTSKLTLSKNDQDEDGEDEDNDINDIDTSSSSSSSSSSLSSHGPRYSKIQTKLLNTINNPYFENAYEKDFKIGMPIEAFFQEEWYEAEIIKIVPSGIKIRYKIDSAVSVVPHKLVAHFLRPKQDEQQQKQQRESSSSSSSSSSSWDDVIALSPPTVSSNPWGYMSVQGNASKKASMKFDRQDIISAKLDLYASGHGCEEFWYANAPNDVGEQQGICGGGTYRQIILKIDDIVAGILYPFPVIYTGGINPLLWKPMTGIQSFNIPPYSFDLSPFVSIFNDGFIHEFDILIYNNNQMGSWFVDPVLLLNYYDINMEPSQHCTGELMEHEWSEPDVDLTREKGLLSYTTTGSDHLFLSGYVQTPDGSTQTNHMVQSSLSAMSFNDYSSGQTYGNMFSRIESISTVTSTSTISSTSSSSSMNEKERNETVLTNNNLTQVFEYPYSMTLTEKVNDDYLYIKAAVNYSCQKLSYFNNELLEQPSSGYIDSIDTSAVYNRSNDADRTMYEESNRAIQNFSVKGDAASGSCFDVETFVVNGSTIQQIVTNNDDDDNDVCSSDPIHFCSTFDACVILPILPPTSTSTLTSTQVEVEDNDFHVPPLYRTPSSHLLANRINDIELFK